MRGPSVCFRPKPDINVRSLDGGASSAVGRDIGMTLSLLLVALILGLHYKYVQLWYGGSGGLARYWRARNGDPLRLLGKASLIASLAFALLAASGTGAGFLIGLSLVGLFAHLLVLAFNWQ